MEGEKSDDGERKSNENFEGFDAQENWQSSGLFRPGWPKKKEVCIREMSYQKSLN
jgi:hypothetical protein